MNKADEYFLQTIHEILNNGYSTEGHKVRPKWKDGTPAHTRYINQKVYKYDISRGEYPISTLRPLFWKSAINEIMWIYQDQSNDLNLLENKYNIHWWNDWELKNTKTIGQRYGATIKKYDLVNKLLKGLKEEPYTRRHIINMYQYSDFNETEGLNPCAYETVWNVRGEYLDMTLHQRSSDFVVSWAINELQYFALMLMVCKSVGLKPGCFMHVVENVHIYDRHFENAKILLERKPHSDPELILKTNKTDFYDFNINNFELVNFEPAGEQLKFELAR